MAPTYTPVVVGEATEPAHQEATDLLAWYDENRRDLPWREGADPYEILVSEVMLQQTRAEHAGLHYRRFLERFPSVEDLAAAKPEEVLAAWSGLGYYRRALALRASALHIQCRGSFPRDAESLRRLPGVGPYTAAAVASIAFGEVVPAVDANAERVLARIIGIPSNPKRSAAGRRIRQRARALLHPARPGDSNQALIELGAMVCRVRHPRCWECPMAGRCVAEATGRPEDFPPRRVRRRREKQKWLVLVVERGETLLLVRTPEHESILAGLWVFPWIRVETEAEGEERWAERFASRYGGRWQLGEIVGEATHSITFRDIQVDIRRALRYRPAGGGSPAGERRLRPGEITELPTTSLVGKVLACISAAAEEKEARVG